MHIILHPHSGWYVIGKQLFPHVFTAASTEDALVFITCVLLSYEEQYGEGDKRMSTAEDGGRQWNKWEKIEGKGDMARVGDLLK